MDEKKNSEIIEIDSDCIRLDAILKLSGVAVTGGQAKYLIQNGKVIVNGKICTIRGKKLIDNDIVEYKNVKYKVQIK